MKKNLFLSFLFIFSFHCDLKSDDLILSFQVTKYLTNRIPISDKRYLSFSAALKLLEKTCINVLVETGTARNGDRNFWGDGGSTIIFGHWAYQNNVAFYSVDISPEAIENVRKATQPYESNIKLVNSDSIAFLEKFGQPIDFLYLDSYDYDYNNPHPSQIHHLQEIIAAYPLLHQKSIVMIDDCDLPQGGKGKLVIDFLIAKGWIIFHEGYQTILIQPDIFKIIY